MNVVDAGTRGEITLTAEVTADCPYDHIVDEYEVVVVYRPDALAVELKSLRAYLNSFESVEISQEALTETVFNQLKDKLNPLALAVTVMGEHYGIETKVKRTL